MGCCWEWAAHVYVCCLGAGDTRGCLRPATACVPAAHVRGGTRGLEVGVMRLRCGLGCDEHVMGNLWTFVDIGGLLPWHVGTCRDGGARYPLLIGRWGWPSPFGRERVATIAGLPLFLFSSMASASFRQVDVVLRRAWYRASGACAARRELHASGGAA